MSGSKHLTTAYVSKESSIKTFSRTFADGTSNGNQMPGNADVLMYASCDANTGAEEPQPLSRAIAAAPTKEVNDRVSEEERFLVATPGSHAKVPLFVVDLQETTIADISQMRLEGCRTRRRMPSSSYHDSFCETVSCAASHGALHRRVSSISSRQAEVLDGVSNVSTASVGYRCSLQPRSGAPSPGANALDTSVAILQHMAYDTALRVEATRSRLTPSDSPFVDVSSSISPLPALLTQQRTMVSATPAIDNVGRGDFTDPNGFAVSGSSEVPSSQLHMASTKLHRRSSTSSSSLLHSLSESELCGAQVRPLCASRNISGQVLSQLADQKGDYAFADEGARSSLVPRSGESPGKARHRLDIAGGAAYKHGEERPSSNGVAAQFYPPQSDAQPDTASSVTDASVCNHDFQQIISHEVKEALTRNMRPSVDDDEDEDEALLHDMLSGQASPTLLPTQKAGSVRMNESHNFTFAPFQLPMGPTSISRLDSVLGTPQQRPGGETTNGFLEHLTARQPPSLSTAALEGDAAGAAAAAASTGAQVGSSDGSSTVASAATSRVSRTHSLRAVSAQAWRFPTLGKDPVALSPAECRLSLEDAEEEEEEEEEEPERNNATTTTRVGGATASASHRTHRPAPSNSRDGSCDSSAARQATLPSGSWRQRGSSKANSASHSRLQPASGRDVGNGGAAALPHGGAKGTSAVGRPDAVADGTQSHQRKRGSVGAGVVCYDGGRLYSQPLVSALSSSSSLPGNGGVPGDHYLRKLEMIHTVYERLVRQSRNAATPKAVKELVAAKRAARSVLENFSVAPQTNPLAQQQLQQRSSGPATTSTGPRSGTSSSQARRSPSLSFSGALGRSAGYYSFGTRVSLSHPNRQALPQQYLGSCPTLMHGILSPRTAVLGSPAVVELLMSGGGISNGVAGNPAAPDGSHTHANSSTGRIARRSLDSVLVHRIESRPLLQLTLFLKHTLRCIREAHSGRKRASDTSKDRSTTLKLGFSAATAVPSSAQDFSKFNDSAAGIPAARMSRNNYFASTVTPLDSAAKVVSDDPELPSGNRRGPSPGSFSSSFTGKTSPNRKSGAPAVMDREALQSTKLQEEQAGVPEHIHADPNNALAVEGAAYHTEMPQPLPAQLDAAAQANTPHKAVDVGDTAQRYYRALTEAEQRVRHIHGVDGMEREVDNESLDLIVYVGMRLMGWLEVVSLLGCGSFGQVFLCKDLRICDGHFVHPGEIGGVDYEYWNCSHAFLPFSSVDIPPTNPPLVAVKVVKSVPLLEQQSVLEAEMLVLIGAQTTAKTSESGNAPPPEDPRCANVAKVLADGICYGHHCIVMERYGANLYEYIAANEHLGLPMYQIRSIGQQLFTALSLIHEECHIIHADIKPENMLLTLDSSRGIVRTDEAPAAAMKAAVVSPDAKGTPEAGQPSSTSTPPRHVQRTEEFVGALTTCSPERSYITLRTGPTAAGRRRNGQLSSRSSGVPLDASTSTISKSRAQSFCHLRSSMTSRVTVVEQTTVPAPEPRRVQALNQSAGMLSSKTLSTSAAAAASPAAASPSAISALVAPPLMIPRLHVKLIDFSSSCYDGGPFYQYIQSRYYRAPEVIVGATYGSGIDIWSSGCLLAELLLGMPLLPGCNDHHQLCLIEEMVGPLPTSIVQEGVNTELYYRRIKPGEEEAGATTTSTASAQSSTPPPPRRFTLRTREEYLHITQCEPQPYMRYFTYQTLQELVRHCPLTLEERRMSNGLQPYVPANESPEIPSSATPSPSVRSEMMKQRFLLFDLLRRLLQTDPKQRPTASQVLTHPFFTSSPPYMKMFTLE